jgi:hypothetical protein
MSKHKITTCTEVRDPITIVYRMMTCLAYREVKAKQALLLLYMLVVTHSLKGLVSSLRSKNASREVLFSTFYHDKKHAWIAEGVLTLGLRPGVRARRPTIEGRCSP